MKTEIAIDRARMREPSAGPAGYQNWSNLAFVHWRVPAERLRAVVPEPLVLDTWEGEAWLGLVAFEMSGVRTWWSPTVPYLSAFPETNLRTYVHLRGAGPGVWFFSLDASRALAVQAARWGWGLNYRWSHMCVNCIYDPSKPPAEPPLPTGDAAPPTMRGGKVQRIPREVEYHSQRWIGPPAGVDLHVAVAPQSQTRFAEPNSLEYFLCERYRLYCLTQRGRLLTARVYHAPYPLVDAQIKECQQDLTDTIGCPVGQAEHVVFSPGVQVRVYALEPAV